PGAWRESPPRAPSTVALFADLFRLVAGELGFDDSFEAGELFALAQVDQGHTLRRPTHLPDRRYPGPDPNAAGRDRHPLAGGQDQRRGDDLAVARRLLDRDHALGAAAVSRVLDDRRALAVTVLGRGQHRLLCVLRDQHRDYALPLVQHHAAHPVRGPAHRANVTFLEAHRLAAGAEQHDVVLAVGQRGADQEVAVVEIDRDDAGGTGPRKIGQRRLLDRPLGRRHEHEAVADELLDRQDRGDLLVLEQRHQVDDRLPARDAAALRNVVHLEPVHAPAVGKAEDEIVRVGDEQVVDEIVLLGSGRLLPPAAAPLCAVLGARLRLHVAAVRERDDHFLGRDQVLYREVGAVRDDLGAPLVTELIADRLELVADHCRDSRRLGQHIEQVDDLHHHLAVFAGDLFLLEPGQALQPQLEYRLRLRFRQTVAWRSTVTLA